MQRTFRDQARSGTRGVWALLAIAVLSLAGCVTVERPIGAELKQSCEDPRPEACTMQYAPVCAFVEGPLKGNPSRKQYSNACVACADSSVVGYISGPCPGSER